MLKRSFILLVIIFLGGLIAHLGAENPGALVLQWYGYEIRTSAFFLALLVVGCVILAFVFGQVWAFLKAAPYMLERWRKRTKVEEGFKLLEQSFEALSAEETDVARRLVSKSQKKLGTMANLVSSYVSVEAERLDGKYGHSYVKRLTSSGDQSFIANQGLADDAIYRKDWASAHDLLTKLFQQKPKSPWVLRKLFDVCMHQGKYDEALSFMVHLNRQAVFSGEDMDFYEASLRYMVALNLLQDGQVTQALKEANTGLKVNHKFVHLMLLITNIYEQSGQIRKKEHALYIFWKQCPRIDIFEHYMDVILSTSPNKFEKLALGLAKQHKDTAVGLLCISKVHVQQKQWKQAREAAHASIKIKPSKNAYRLLSFIETSTGGDQSAQWLNKALAVPELAQDGDNTVRQFNEWCKTYTSATSNLQLGKADGQ